MYFGADGFIWAIPAADGTPHKIDPGHNVTVSPDRKTLVLTRNHDSNPTFASLSLDRSGPDVSSVKQIHISRACSNAPVSIGTRSLSRDGKQLINISPSDSWFYRVAMLDIATGRITPIPVTYAGDTVTGDWTPDGQVLSVALPLWSHIWRFLSSSR